MERLNHTPEESDLEPKTILQQAESELFMVQLFRSPERIGSDVVNFYPAEQPGKILESIYLEKNYIRHFFNKIAGILIDPREPAFIILFFNEKNELAAKNVVDGEYKPYFHWQPND